MRLTTLLRMKMQRKGLLGRLLLPKMNKPPYNHIVQIGDPILRTRCKDVPREKLQSPEFRKLLFLMEKALDMNDGLGISAPQLGMNLRVFAMQCTKAQIKMMGEEEAKRRRMTEFPFKIFINPRVTFPSDARPLEQREGCCSMHGYSAVVDRKSKVYLTAIDQNGSETSLSASDWVARIIQHEMDHLDGIVFTDKMSSPESLIFNYWKTVNVRAGEFRLSYGGFRGWRKYYYVRKPFKFPGII